MAGTFTINTSEVTKKASEISNLLNSFKSQVENLTQTEGTLNGMWEGEAKETFHSEFQKDIVKMQQFHNNMQKYVTALQEIVQEYVKAENANLSTASTRKV